MQTIHPILPLLPQGYRDVAILQTEESADRVARNVRTYCQIEASRFVLPEQFGDHRQAVLVPASANVQEIRRVLWGRAS